MPKRDNPGDFKRGADHHDARLTPEQVLEIRKAKGSHAKIALRYGISAAAVGKIKRRESWGWLTNAGTESLRA